jgi:hypothetical protein
MKLILVVFMLCLSEVSFAETDFSKGVEMMREGESQEIFIQKFAEVAKAKDGAGVIGMVDPSIIPPNKEDMLNLWLKREIFPFFESFSKIHNYKQITNAVMPGGKVGLWHYTYIVDANEKVRPFRIAVINTEDGPKMLDFIANECVKDRHPFCP